MVGDGEGRGAEGVGWGRVGRGSGFWLNQKIYRYKLQIKSIIFLHFIFIKFFIFAHIISIVI